MNKEEFLNKIKELGIDYNEEQIKKLEQYKELLIEYNSHTNLTAIKEEEGIYLKHFYDSLTILKYIKDKEKVLDIGTGAGFPGAVLAIFKPNSHFVLLDSNNKKIKFLEQLKEKLALTNIEPQNERAEEYVKKHLEDFDIVTSRAVAEVRILIELALPALKINGSFIAQKANLREEIVNSKSTLEILKGKIKKQEELILPIENSKRTILVIEHFASCENIYPRSYDKIKKKPLKNIFK